MVKSRLSSWQILSSTEVKGNDLICLNRTVRELNNIDLEPEERTRNCPQIVHGGNYGAGRNHGQ